MFWMWNVLKKFDYASVAGHELLCTRLRQSVASQRTVSAYLFSGAQGVGKKTVSWPFAAALLCESPKNGAPCLTCSSCRLIASASPPDCIVLSPPADKKSIGVELVREKIIKEAYVRPFSSNRKVFLIENGELMTQEAQNALLKLLEEPPCYAVFIIMTTAQDQLLETIRSRCLKLQFLPLKEEVCRSFFQRTFHDKEASRCQLATTFSQGIIGRGQRMILEDDYYALYQETIYKLCSLTDSHAALCEMQNFLTENKEQIEDIIDFILVFLRDALRLALKDNAKLICNNQQHAITTFSKNLSPGKLIILMEAAIHYRERLHKNASFTVAGLEFLTRIQEEIYDKGNWNPI